MNIISRCLVAFTVIASSLFACSEETKSGSAPQQGDGGSGGAGSDSGTGAAATCAKMPLAMPPPGTGKNCSGAADCCEVSGATVECRTIKGSFYQDHTACCLPNGSSCSPEPGLEYGPQNSGEKFTSTKCCSRMCGADGTCGCMPAGLGTACVTDDDCCPAASGEPARCEDFGSPDRPDMHEKWCCLPSGANALPSRACCSGYLEGDKCK